MFVCDNFVHIIMEVKVPKRIIFIWFLLLCFSAFGEEAPKKNSIVSNNGEIQFEKESKISNSLTGLEHSFTEPLTYYEALAQYREAARLEWIWGVGLTKEITFLMPLALEIQVPVIQEDGRFKWLFQAGGTLYMFRATRRLTADYSGRLDTKFESGGIVVVPVFQTGLKYNFSKQAYGSFRVGPLGLLTGPFPPILWTGGLFFGFGSDLLTTEIGLQSFYLVPEDIWDFGVVVSIGSVLKKWWSKK